MTDNFLVDSGSEKWMEAILSMKHFGMKTQVFPPLECPWFRLTMMAQILIYLGSHLD